MPDNSSPCRIATRGSALALAQANQVLDHCRAAFPERTFAIKVIKTTGDKLQTASLTSGQLAKGLFTKELETALLEGDADLAVHSLKDLPTELPAGLTLGAVLPRADVRDVLVYRHADSLGDRPGLTEPVRQDRRGFRPEMSIAALPHGAVVGTSSPRRAAQCQYLRPDLRSVPIRGNVGTRLRKLAEQSELDALLLAAAGLDRLGIRCLPGGLLQGEEVPGGLAASRLSLGEMLPCVGQGAIAIETRAQDPRVHELCTKLDHPETRACVTAERALLAAMGGGCAVPIAAWGEVIEGRLRLCGVSFLQGQPRRGELTGAIAEAAALGEALARDLR